MHQATRYGLGGVDLWEPPECSLFGVHGFAGVGLLILRSGRVGKLWKQEGVGRSIEEVLVENIRVLFGKRHEPTLLQVQSSRGFMSRLGENYGLELQACKAPL